ncbi:MAG: dCTP deaminase [Verrucomicrobia bacterium]|nr:dCTP deaminase [Verrucomicrobiota bacterium]
MILSDKSIRELIGRGEIQFFPECDPKNIRPVGVRLHLGPELLIPLENQKIYLDSSDEIQFEKVDISQREYVLKPGQFVLGSTWESFQVPRDIVCHIEGRSTVARLGLAVHCTSSIVDGNYEEARTVVLEIKNIGPFEIVLQHKAALAMLIFTRLSTEIEQNPQLQYAGQRGVVAPNMKLQKR